MRRLDGGTQPKQARAAVESENELMQETTYLNGLVRKWVLQVFEAAPGADAPVVKRLLLPQGELAQFYDSELPIHYIAFIELREGLPRGNHFHKVKEEFICLLRGEVQLDVKDLASERREIVFLRAGDVVWIATGVAHALRVIKAGQAVEFSSARFDLGDIHRYLLDEAPPGSLR
jgi:mannose-6-phosphate isomerase-like protein (cupin superfamily)